MMGKLHTYMENHQTGPVSYNMQRTELKMNKALSRRPETTELEKTGRNLFNSCLRNDFLDSDSKHKRQANSNNQNYSRGKQNKTERNEMK